MKYIVIVPDGMADNPIESLGDKTPLEVSHRSNMNYLSQSGSVGLVQTIPDKMKPGSEIGNLSLLGYNPAEHFSGRAPLEAANLGIKLADDEIAFRCNLVTIVDSKMEDYSAGHISSKEAATLIAALTEQMDEKDVRFIAGKSYRHLMIMKTTHFKDLVKIKCEPPHDILGKNINKYLPQSTAAIAILRIMEKSRRILEGHPINKVRIDLGENPANMIWLWGQGGKPQLPSFKEKFGVEGAIISAVDLVNGIGRLAGLEVIDVPGITGYYDTNYLGKGEYALQALKKKDFVFIHIEGPDEAGHNGDAKAKISCIEHIDREIVGPILANFGKYDDVRIMVLPDHPTPVALRTHTSDPVPFVMYGKGLPLDTCEEFGEREAAKKGLKFKNGEELMNFFMNRYL